MSYHIAINKDEHREMGDCKSRQVLRRENSAANERSKTCWHRIFLIKMNIVNWTESLMEVL